MGMLLNIFDRSDLGIVAFISITCLCLLIHRLCLQRGKYNLPPSPRFRLPIIGHLHLMEPNIVKPCARFRKQFGDVFSLQMGSHNCVVFCGYDVIKEALVKYGDAISNRPYLPMIERMNRNAGIIIANDEKWKEHRQFIASTLRDLGMGRSVLEEKIHEEITHLIAAIDEKKGSALDPKKFIETNIGNIICSLVFGSTFGYDDPQFKALINALEENASDGYVTGVINFLPFLQWIPGDFFQMKKVIRNSDNLHTFAEKIIKKHQEADYDENNVNDFIRAYDKRLKQLQKSGQETSFSTQELTANVIDLFLAGVETSSIALLWSIALLASYPDKQLRMYEEILNYVGVDRLPSQQDRIKLAYVEAFYTETLRYENLLSSGSFRAVSRDLTFRGYDIPAGTTAIINYGSVLLDPDIWGDPETFRPERFIAQSGSFKKFDEFIAFSVGRRNCVGEPLARMEVLLFLSALVQRYEISWPEGKTPTEADFDGEHRSLHRPNPYEVIFKRRTNL